MRCFRRSTRLFASGSVLLLLWTAPLYGGASSAVLTTAIEAAVRARVGHLVTVTVSNMSGARLVRESSSMVAVPDPSARIGVPIRFVLAAGTAGSRTRIG